MRVLIVEDEFLIQSLLRWTVEEVPGCTVSGVARDAAQAREQAEIAAPEVGVFDVRLPGGTDGIDLALELRDRYGTRAVFVTGSSDPGNLARIEAMNPVALLRKPFDPQALKAALASAGPAGAGPDGTG